MVNLNNFSLLLSNSLGSRRDISLYYPRNGVNMLIFGLYRTQINLYNGICYKNSLLSTHHPQETSLIQIRSFSQTCFRSMDRGNSLSPLSNHPRLSASTYYQSVDKRTLFNNYDSVMNQHLQNFDPNILNIFYVHHTERLEEVNRENFVLKDLYIEADKNPTLDYTYEIDSQSLTLLLRESKVLRYKKNLILENPWQTRLTPQEFEAAKQYLEQQDRIIKDNIDVLDRLLYGEPIVEESVEANQPKDDEDSENSDNNGVDDNGGTNIEGSSEGPAVTSLNNESFNSMDIISETLNDIILNSDLDNTMNLILSF